MHYDMLKMMRTKRGYSQQQMAQLLGLVSRNGYALKEKGMRRFSVDEGIAIARLLNTTVEALFSSEEVTKPKTSREAHEHRG